MFKIEEMKWTRAPRDYVLKEDCIEITTEAHTDLWQMTECAWKAHDGQQPD